MTPAMWQRVTEIVERAYPEEGCGWIADEEVRALSGGTRDGFRFRDTDVMEMMARSGVIVFHSHPDGDDALSMTDIAWMAPGGVVLHPVPQMVIAVAGGRARAAALWWLDGPAPHLIVRYVRDGETWRYA